MLLRLQFFPFLCFYSCSMSLAVDDWLVIYITQIDVSIELWFEELHEDYWFLVVWLQFYLKFWLFLCSRKAAMYFGILFSFLIVQLRSSFVANFYSLLFFMFLLSNSDIRVVIVGVLGRFSGSYKPCFQFDFWNDLVTN